MKTVQATLPCVLPFELRLSLRFVEGFSPMKGEQRVSHPSGSLSKAIRVDGETVAFTVTQERPEALTVRLLSERSLDETTAARALDRVRHYLSADEDLAPFYARAEQDPPFHELTRRLSGLHHVRFPSAFEAAVWGVINQRIPQARARELKAGLVKAAGGSLVLDGVALGAFPEPGEVRALGEERVSALIPGERKAKAVWAVAEAFAAVDEAFLLKAPVSTVETWLKGIYGVGDFTSAFVLYRALGRFSRQPVHPGLLRAASAVYGKTMGEQELLRRSSEYGDWSGHWSLYLWASSFVEPV